MRAIMGRLSPFEGGLAIGLAVIISIAIMPSKAAPVQETSVGRYANEKGCYYFNKHYPSGENIHTNEPCLNCTCVGSTLMCYLRVCPMVKPLGASCKSVMHVGDCCPQYWCPEAYPRSSTEKPETEVRGCYLDDKYYDEGARIPMDPMKPCEVCYCIRNTSVCTTQECELKVDGCFPQYKAGMCCPSRYNCTEDAATTIPPGVMEPEEYEGCKVGGVLYKDGEQVPSLDECENCYCMKHEVVCAVQECKAPADNCVPQATPEGQCCPDKYDCPSGTEIPEWATTHMVATEDLLRNVTTPVDLDHKFTSVAGLTIPAFKIQDHTLFTERDLDTQTLSVVLSTISDAKTITEEPVRRVEAEAAETTTAEVTSLSEVFTETVITENATLHPADLVSRPREPKITEVPDEMFSSVTIVNVTTGRPIFYRPGIPGEGICRQNDVIYQNREEVPSIDPCRLNCRCVNSVIKCDHVECVLSPPGSNCKVTRDPEECCPKYVCDTPADITTESDQFTHIPSVIQQKQEQITISDVPKATDKQETTISEKAVTSKQEQEEITFKEESITESVIKFTTLSSSTSSSTEETGQKEVDDFTPTVMSFTSTESKTEVSEAKMTTVVSEVSVITDVKSTESAETPKFTDTEQPSTATETVEIVTLEDGDVLKGMKEDTTIASTMRSSTATPSTLTESSKTSTKEEEIFTTTVSKLTTTLKESSEGVFIATALRPSEELATDSEIEIKADATKATTVAEDIPSMKLTTEEAVTSRSTVEITGVEQENGTERTQSLETETSTAVTTQRTKDTESVSELTVEDAEPSEVTKLVSEEMSTKPKDVESVTQQTAKEPTFEESTSKSITEVVKISDTTIAEKEKVGTESVTVETLAAKTTKGPAESDSTSKLATEISTVEEDISESVSEELEIEKMKVEDSTLETSKEHAITEPTSKLTTVEIESVTEVTQAISEELSTGDASIQSLEPQTSKDSTIIGSTPKTTTETSVSIVEITKTITDSVSTESVETETVLAGATTVLESASKIVTEATTPSEGASKAISDELSTEEVKTVASDSQITKGSETEESKSAETSDKTTKDKVSTESTLIIQDTKAPSVFDSTPKSTTAVHTAPEGITESLSAELSTENLKYEVLTSETAITESASELTVAEEKSTKQATKAVTEELLNTEIMEIESLTPEIAKEIFAPNITTQAEISPEEVTKAVTERISTESLVAETSDAQAIETTSDIGHTSRFKTESTQPSEKTTKPVSEGFSTERMKVETVTSQTTKELETSELTSKLSTEKIIPSIETTQVTSKEMITEITQAATVIPELTTAPTSFSSTSKILTTDTVSRETTTEITEELSLETLEPESIVSETANELKIISSTLKSTAEMTSEETAKSTNESTESVKIELFTTQAAKEPGSLESDLKSTTEGESIEKTTKITTKQASTEISENDTISLLTTKEPVSVKSITTDTEATTPVILDSTFKLTTGDVRSSDEAPEAVSKDIDTESLDMESFTPKVTKEPATSELTTEQAESTKESTKFVSTEAIEAKSITPQTGKESVSKLETKLTTESTETIREITKAVSEETSSHSADIETLGAETTEMPKILDFTSELTTGTTEFLDEATKAISVELDTETFTLHSAQDRVIIETTSESAPKETESSKESTNFISETTSSKVSEVESVVPQTAKKTTGFEITTKLTTKAASPLGQTTKFLSEEASTFSVGTEIKEMETTKVPSLLDITSKLATETTESSKGVTKPFGTTLSIEGFESSTEHAVTEFTSRLTTEQRTPTREATKFITEDVSMKTLSPQTIKESTAVTTSAVETTEKPSSMGITTKDVTEERSTSAGTEMKEAETTKPTVLDISSKLTIKETELSEGTTSFSKDLITESFDIESVTPQTTKESTVIGFTSKLTTDESTREADGIVTKVSEDTSLASQTTKEPIVIESTFKLTTEAAIHLEETTKFIKEDGSTFSVATETVKAEATKVPVIEDATSKLVTEKSELPEELTETDSKDLITESIVIDSFTAQTSKEPSIVELTSTITIDEAKSTAEATKLVIEEVSTKTLTAESVVPQTAKETVAVESTTKLTTEGATVFGETTKAVTEEPSTHSVVSEILKTEATKSSEIFDSTFKLTTDVVPSSEKVTKVISTDLSSETVETQSFTPQTTEVPITVESTSKLTVQETEETKKLLIDEVSTETAKTETFVPQTFEEPEHVEFTTKLITEADAPLEAETKSVSEEVTTSSVDSEMFPTEATKQTSFDIISKLGTENTEPSESTTETSSKHISTKTAEFELSTSQTAKQPVVVESTMKLTFEGTESIKRTTETSDKDISTQTSEFESATVESATKLTIKEAEPTKESTKNISLDVSTETIEAESITPQTTKKPSVSKSTTKLTTESAATVSETTKVISEETSIYSVDSETLEDETTKLPEKSTEEPTKVVSVDVSSTASETKSVISQTSKVPLTVESTVKLTTEVSALAAETIKSTSEESASSILETEATKAPAILEFTSILTSKELESPELTKAVSEDITTESIITESFRPQTVSESITVKTTSELIIQDAESTTDTSKSVSEELSIKSLEDKTIIPQTSTFEVTSKLTTDAISDFADKKTSATHTKKTSVITETTSKLTTEATVLPKEIPKDIGDDAISTESDVAGTFLSETTKAPAISEFDAEASSTESVAAQTLASETTKEPVFVQDTSKLTTKTTESVTPTSVDSSSHLTSEEEILTETITKFISAEVSSESDEGLKVTTQTTEEPEIISSTFKLSSKEAPVVPLEETISVSEITSTDVADIKSITQSTTEEPTSMLTREDETSGETTRAFVEDITHELRTATTKLSEEISTSEVKAKLTTFRPADTEEITKPEIKIITELPITPAEETWKSEIKNQTKVTAISVEETSETETKLPKFTTAGVISSETTSRPESEKFTKQPTVNTELSIETLKIEEVTHKLPSISPEVDGEIHELTTLETLSKMTQTSEVEDVAFKLTTKSDTFTETPKIALSEISTEVPIKKVTESTLLEETTFKTVTEDIEQITNITTVSQVIKSSETPRSTPKFEIEHPITLKHTETDSEAQTTKYIVEVTSKTTAFPSLDESGTIASITQAAVTEKQSIPELITKPETVSEGFGTVAFATANATGFEIKIPTTDATEIVEDESISKLTTKSKMYSPAAEDETPVTSITDVQAKVLTPKITITGETFTERMKTTLFEDEGSTDIDLSSKFTTEVSSKVTETKVSTPVTTLTEEEISRPTMKTEDSSRDIMKTTKYPLIEDVTLIVTMEKDMEEFETSSTQTTREIAESTQKSKMTSEVTYTETPLTTKDVEVQDVTSNFTLPEIDIAEQTKIKSATEKPTTSIDILPTMKSIPSEIPEKAISDAHSVSEDEDITSKLLVFTESTATKVTSVQTMEDIGIESTSKEIMKETVSDFFEKEMSTLQPTKMAAKDEGAPTAHTTIAEDIKTRSFTTAYVTEPAESHTTALETKAPQTDDKKQETTTVFTASTEQMEAETQKAETTLDEELEEFKLKLSSQFAPFSDDLDIETSSILPLETEYESTAITTELTETSGLPVSEITVVDEVKITKAEEPSETSKLFTSTGTETSTETIHTLKHEATTFKLPTTSQENYIGKTTRSEITEVTTARLTEPEQTKETEKMATEISISAETARVADEEELIKARLTTLTEISVTGDAAEKETEGVSVISEETILSNRTFAADAMLAHSTIAMSTMTEASQTKTEESTVSDFASSHATTSPSEDRTRSFSTESSPETTKATETMLKEISRITEKVKQDYSTSPATLPSTRQIIAEAEVSTEKLETTSEQTEVTTQFSSTSKEFISSPTQTSSKFTTATENFTADITKIVSSTEVVFDETSSTSTVHTPTENVFEITPQSQTSLDSVSAVSLKDIKDVTSKIETTSDSETTIHESPTTSKSVEVLSEKDVREGETVTPEGKLIEEEVASTLSLENGTIESSPAVSTSLEILEFIGKSTTADKTVSTDIGVSSSSTMKPESATKEDTALKTSLEDITESAQPEKITTSYTEMETEKANVTFEGFSSSATPKILTEGISEISTLGSTETGEQAKSSVTKISTEVLAAEETTKLPDLSESTKFATDEVTEKFITDETKTVEAAVSVTNTYPEMTNISSTEMQILLEVTTPAEIFSEKGETDVSEFTSDTVAKEEVFADAEGSSVKLPVSTEIITEPTAVHVQTTSEIKPDVKVTDDVTMIWKTEKTSEAEKSSKTVESETTLALKTSSASDHFRTTGIYISEKPSVAVVETTEMTASAQLTEKTTESVYEEEKLTTISEVIPGKEEMPTTITSIYEGKVSEQTSTDSISITETATPLVSKISIEHETSTNEKILPTSEEAEKQKTGADMPAISTTDSKRFESTSKVTEPTFTVTESTSSTATTPYPEAVETETIGIIVTTETSEETSAKGLTEKDIPFTLVTSSAIPKDVTEIEEGETVTESGCFVNGTRYGDGEAIDSVEPCEKCHCASGDITCFKVICKLPKAGCIPKTISIDECCPSSYDCPTDGENVAAVTIASTLKVTEKDFTTPIPISFMFSSTPASIASTVLITKPSDQPLPETTIERKEYITGTEDTDVSITTHVPTDTILETSEKATERSTVIESTEYSTQKPHATATQSAVEEHSTAADIRSGTPRIIPDAIPTVASTATISESEIKTTVELTSTVTAFDVTQSEKQPQAVDLATEGPKAEETSSLVAEKETKVIFDKVSTTAHSDTDATEESDFATEAVDLATEDPKAEETSSLVAEKETKIIFDKVSTTAYSDTDAAEESDFATEAVDLATEDPKAEETSSLVAEKETKIIFDKVSTTAYSDTEGTEESEVIAFSGETAVTEGKAYSHSTTAEPTKEKDPEILTVTSTEIANISKEATKVPVTAIEMSEAYITYQSTEATGYSEEQETETEVASATEIMSTKLSEATTNKSIEIFDVKSSTISTTQIAERGEIPKTTLKGTGIPTITEATGERETLLKTIGVPTVAETITEKEVILRTTEISAVTDAETEKEISLKETGIPTITEATGERETLLKTIGVPTVAETITEKEVILGTTEISAVTDAETEKAISLKPTGVPTIADTTKQKEIILKATDISAVTEATTEAEIHLKPTDVPTTVDSTREKEIILKTTDISAVSQATTEEEIRLKPTDVSTVTDETTEKDSLLITTAGSDMTTGKEILPKTTGTAETEATTKKEIHLKPTDISTITNKTTEKEILPQTTDVSAASDITTEREILLKTTGVSVITDETKDEEVRFPVMETEDRITSTTISDHTHSIPSETYESILEKESTKKIAAEEITPISTALPSKLPKFDDFVTSTFRVSTEKLTTAKSFTTETALEAEATSKPPLEDVTTTAKSDESEELYRDTESIHDFKKVTVITESVWTDAVTSTPSSTTVPISSSEAFDSATRNDTDQMQSEVSDVTSTLSTLHPFVSTKLTAVDLATSTDKEVDHVSVTSEQAIRKTTVSEKLPEKSQTQVNETRSFDNVLPTGDVFSAPRDETSTPAGSSMHASTLTAETSKVPMYIPSLIPQEIDSVTETAQINQTILSLSKERLSTVSAEITEEDVSATSTEIKIPETTTVSSITTEKQTLETIKQSVIPETASPTIGKEIEIQTSSSVEPSTAFDHVSTTDKVFTFVSTRFTDVTTDSMETETILTPKHDILMLNVTDVSEKEEELRNFTSSSATVSETSPVFEISTKSSFTTRKPALKSVDDSLPSITPYDIDTTNLTEIQKQEEASTKSSITTLTPAITIYKEEDDLTKTDISLIETKASEDVIDKSTTVHLEKDTFPTSAYDFTVPDKGTSTSDERTSIAVSIEASSIPTEETTLKGKSTVETTEVEKEISVSVSEQFTTYGHDISPKTSDTQTEDKIYVANLTTLEDVVDITFASDNETVIMTTHRKFEDVTNAAEETTSSPYLKTSIPAISFTTFLDDLNATRKIADESLETISSKDAIETITARASEQTSGAILTEKAGTITSDIRSTPFISKVETSTIEKAYSSSEVTDVPTQTEITESETFGGEVPAKVSNITVSSTFVEDIVTEKLPDVTKGATKIATEHTTLVPTVKDTTLEEETLVQNMSSVTTEPDTAADITAQSTTGPSKATTVHETSEQARQDVTGLLTKAYKAIETTPTAFTVTAPASEKEEETTAGIEMRKRLPFGDSAEVTDELVYSTVPEPDDDFLLDEGSCIFEGRIYESAEQIPRADPCEFCFCFRGDIICLQQSCPPPAPNCHRTMIAGYCCPRYDCPVYMTSRNISSLSRRKGVQPIIIQRRIEKREIRPAMEVKGCQVNGTFYEVGSTVTSASGPCLHCMCQDGGIMRCDPQKCKPQAPLMLKMNNSFFRSRR